MDPTDPTTPDTTPDAPDTSQAVDDGGTPPELEPARAEPEDADAKALAAMDKGLEAAKQATTDSDGEVTLPVPEVPPKPPKKEKAPKVPRETPAATGADPVPGTPEAAAAAQAPALVSPDSPPPPDAMDEAIEAELKSVGIKSKEQHDRVREIITANHLYRRHFEQLGIALDNLELDVPKYKERVDQANQVIQGVLNTGATGEQYGRTLTYLEMSVAANQGNVKAAEAAYAAAMEEANHWAKLIGKEVPGVYDPLAEHQDLQDDVEQMNISRERALEIASLRAANKQSTAQSAAAAAAQQQERVAKEAYQELQRFDKSMHKDQVYMQFYRPALDKAVRKIRADFPPEEWVDRTQAVYELIRQVPISKFPAPAKSKVPTKDQPVQTRNRVPGPAGGTPPLEPKIPKDPFAALEMGLASLNR